MLHTDKYMVAKNGPRFFLILASFHAKLHETPISQFLMILFHFSKALGNAVTSHIHCSWEITPLWWFHKQVLKAFFVCLCVGFLGWGLCTDFFETWYDDRHHWILQLDASLINLTSIQGHKNTTQPRQWHRSAWSCKARSRWLILMELELTLFQVCF